MTGGDAEQHNLTCIKFIDDELIGLVLRLSHFQMICAIWPIRICIHAPFFHDTRRTLIIIIMIVVYAGWLLLLFARFLSCFVIFWLSKDERDEGRNFSNTIIKIRNWIAAGIELNDIQLNVFYMEMKLLYCYYQRSHNTMMWKWLTR